MPTKGKRAASRQAKLRQKRRRGKGGTQVFDAGPTESEVAAKQSVAEAEPEPQAAPRPVAVAAPQARPARRSRQPSAAEAAPRYQYLGAELRRIGALTIVIFAIIVGLSFVMGS